MFCIFSCDWSIECITIDFTSQLHLRCGIRSIDTILLSQLSFEIHRKQNIEYNECSSFPCLEFGCWYQLMGHIHAVNDQMCIVVAFWNYGKLWFIILNWQSFNTWIGWLLSVCRFRQPLLAINVGLTDVNSCFDSTSLRWICQLDFAISGNNQLPWE